MANKSNAYDEMSLNQLIDVAFENMVGLFPEGPWVLPEGRPKNDAPLIAFVYARIILAKAAWSRELESGLTTLQFRDWFPLHVAWETAEHPARSNEKGWSEALDILRVVCRVPGAWANIDIAAS